MPANSWPENDAYNELDAIGSLLSDLSKDESEETFSATPSCYQGRRRKAAVVLIVVWSSTVALHLISWGFWLVLGLTTLWGVHSLRLILARKCEDEIETDYLPSVSLVVAAKNEQAVIGNLVKTLCSLDYPIDRYEVWVIDDNSTDQTPNLLAKLQQKYQKLNVLRREAGASGGKSGALNQVLPLTQGEILAVFDADAQLSADLLQRVLPLFARHAVGAVQVRKAIANKNVNFWTRGQMAEMALDSYLQQQRVALGGIGELRGNGQFVRREALLCCGGWNEETITDDLDLTFRLHLEQWEIEFLSYPAVEEEGVTNALALWHQRSRWAEGGYQRYLDYWRLLLKSRMAARKKFDLLMFMLVQYIIPIAELPDLLMALARNRVPVLAPFTGFTITLSMVWMFLGLKRIRTLEDKLTLSALSVILLQTLRGTLYMVHWLLIMVSTTARMSVRPKRLRWVKTVHQGDKH